MTLLCPFPALSTLLPSRSDSFRVFRVFVLRTGQLPVFNQVLATPRVVRDSELTSLLWNSEFLSGVATSICRKLVRNPILRPLGVKKTPRSRHAGCTFAAAHGSCFGCQRHALPDFVCKGVSHWPFFSFFTRPLGAITNSLKSAHQLAFEPHGRRKYSSVWRIHSPAIR